jgi:hypothetical protein
VCCLPVTGLLLLLLLPPGLVPQVLHPCHLQPQTAAALLLLLLLLLQATQALLQLPLPLLLLLRCCCRVLVRPAHRAAGHLCTGGSSPQGVQT